MADVAAVVGAEDVKGDRTAGLRQRPVAGQCGGAENGVIVRAARDGRIGCSAQMHPAGDRRNHVVVGEKEHVPAWRGKVRFGRDGNLHAAGRLGGDGQVDQPLAGVERVSG